MIRILNLSDSQALLEKRGLRLQEAERIVAPIIEDVRRRGDEALLEYARRFDGLDAASVRVPKSAIDLKPDFLAALETASKNIREFARTQLPKSRIRRLPDGRKLGQIVRPLESMGAYIPAGRYPLPSTLLMTVIPAQVAGVRAISMASPRPSAEILGTAAFLGVGNIYRMGGAHAIAALAFGTETVAKVDRIVGPGSIYVAAAKKLLAGEVGIDFVAGPTEIAIIAEDGNPKVLAADMLAQAEHDVEAAAILLTTSRRLADEVAREIEIQLQDLATAPVAREAIGKNSAIILVDSLEQAVSWCNRFAPEHLSIPNHLLLKQVSSAGSVFVGPYSPEAAGDYASGPNHVLPTQGAGRLRGGLSAADFVKVISVQELTPAALHGLAPAITTLARAEGLEAHARSVEVRLNHD
jgi:histidinol dehydrogenase